MPAVTPWGCGGLSHIYTQFCWTLEGRCTSSLLQGHPPSLRFGHPDVATDGTDTSARKTPATTQHTEPRQPSPTPHAKHQPPGSRLKGDSPPPPQFARHGAHILSHHATQRTGGIPRTPEPQMRRGAYILCRDIRVSELCEDGSPAGAKRIICTSHDKTVFIRETQKSRRFRRISGIFCEVRPLGLEPRTH